jgi:hypothetical protein
LLALMAFTQNSLKILAKEWIVALFNDILMSGKIPKQKKKKVRQSYYDPSSFNESNL